MIHSASLRATGSAMVASAWVASTGLCLRMRSMTFSSASLSAFEVDEVAATAAGDGGLRAGGKAACRRVAGARIGGLAGAAVAGVVNLAGVTKAGALFFADAWATTLRAIGRAFGNGTFGAAQASAPKADKPNASARLVASAVDCKAAARLDRVTAFPQGESFDRASPMSIWLNMRTKYQKLPHCQSCLRQHRGKIAAGPRQTPGGRGPFA